MEFLTLNIVDFLFFGIIEKIASIFKKSKSR